MWFIPLYALLAGVAPNGNVVTLPQVLHGTLDQEYPGWKLASTTPQINNEFKKHWVNKHPSLVSGDFDHDGKKDYAIQIVLTTPGQEEEIIIVFLAREGNTYEENIVQSMGIDLTSYLWVVNTPLTETGPNAQEILTKKDILMILGGPVGQTTIAYEDGKLQEIKTPENVNYPEAPTPPTQAEL